MTQAALPRDLAAVAENVIRGTIGRFQRRQPKDIGRWRNKDMRFTERQLSPEDLSQEVFRLIQSRLDKLPASPAELERYLRPKAHEAARWQVRGMTRPVRVSKAEQKILSTEQRIREARERDPRFAALGPVSPGEVFVRLAKDPGFASLLRKEGGKRFFGTQSGVERTLEAGLPSAARDAQIAKAIRGERALLGRQEEGVLRGLSGPTPLDELLAKQAEAFTGPMARMELALQALTGRQREIVTRALGLGRAKQSLREIADELKIHFTTVHEHYKAGLKRLEAAAKAAAKPARPAQPAPAAKPAEAPKKTAAELVNERLAEAKRRIEGRRRWEFEAPIRRMREKEPIRQYDRPRVWGETAVPGDPSRKRTREDIHRAWELLKRSIQERRGGIPPKGTK